VEVVVEKETVEVNNEPLELEIEVLEERIAPSSIGSNGYEGQPGNQGNGTNGYEGQPGNQGGN
jgi:hypothetical protein